MKKLKKFKTTIILSAIIAATLGFIYKQNSGPAVGTKATELAYKSPAGKIITLSSLKGKVVLIDFWASWCGPCRRENPALVNAYNIYKDKTFVNGKGFTIYSYSLDQDANKWKAAIEQDQLTWPYHTSDLKGWQAEGAAKYGVNSIPMNFLIDGKGNILAKNLRGSALNEALDKYLKK